MTQKKPQQTVRFFFGLFLTFWVTTGFAQDYLIVANTPGLKKADILHLCMGKTIVALDGAADQLQECDIQPHIIIGDFDSIETPPAPQKNREIEIVHSPNQNFTDLEKAIRHCDEKGARSITIVNALGGRMDHTLWNMRLLRRYYKSSRSLTVIADDQQLSYHKDETIQLNGIPGKNCGIFAAPKATVTSKGLTYDMDDYELQYGHQESVANTIKDTEVTLEIHGEVIIVWPTDV